VVLGAVARRDLARGVGLAEALLFEPDRERRIGDTPSSDMSATIVPESTPPERNTPSGTSLMRWLCTAALSVCTSASPTRPRRAAARRPTTARGREAPEALDARAALARLGDEDRARRQLRDAREHRRGPGDVAERQVVVQRLRIESGLDAAGEQALRFRTPEDRSPRSAT
jgi:hypothetical protein